MTDRIEQLKSILATEPDDAFCMYGIALEHAKRGESEAAIEWFDRTLAVDPAYCYAYFHKAKTQNDAGDVDAAIVTLRSGLPIARSAGDLKAASEIEGFLFELED